MAGIEMGHSSTGTIACVPACKKPSATPFSVSRAVMVTRRRSPGRQGTSGATSVSIPCDSSASITSCRLKSR